MAPASSGLAKPLRGRLLTLAPSLLGGSAWALHGERATATAGGSGPGRSGSSCGRQREGNGLQSRQIELTRRVVDIQAHDRARLVEVDVNPWRDLARVITQGVGRRGWREA